MIWWFFFPLEYFSSKTRTPTRTRTWFYWIYVPEMLLHTRWAPWKWKLLVEANTKDGQPGSVSNPTGSTHWFASALRAAIPAGGKITTTALYYMAFPRRFPKRLFHEAFHRAVPRATVVWVDPRLESRGSAGKTGSSGLDWCWEPVWGLPPVITSWGRKLT